MKCVEEGPHYLARKGKGAKVRKKIGWSPLTVWGIVWPVRVASKVELLFSGGREMRKRTDWWTFHFQSY